MNSTENVADLTRCLNCGQIVLEEFCGVCGQDKNGTSIKLRDFADDFIGEFFSFDSKIIRSIVPLLTKPGFLTTEYVAGKRVRYMFPSRIYFIISVIFFFLVNRFDQVTLDLFKDDATLPAILSAKGMTLEQFAPIFQEKYNALMPSLLVGIVPLFTLAVILLHVRQKRTFVEHFIFSFHFFSFILIAFIPTFFHIDWLSLLSFTIVGAYLVLSLRTVYQQSWLLCTLKASGLFVALFILLYAYFEFVYQVTVNSL